MRRAREREAPFKPFIRHPRESGVQGAARRSSWVPAFAGTTRIFRADAKPSHAGRLDVTREDARGLGKRRAGLERIGRERGKEAAVQRLGQLVEKAAG
jgi:hypothetical protein